MLVDIYRSSCEEGLYLYVLQSDGFNRVPEQLLKQFGKAERAMSLDLASKQKLARADITKVIQQIREAGYYLQLPPLSEKTDL